MNFEKIRLLLMQITDTYTNSKKETLKIKSLNEMQLSEYNKVKYLIFTYILLNFNIQVIFNIKMS